MAAHGRFEAGTLAAAIAASTQRALALGALLPIPTHARVIHERGIPFVVRVLEQLARKQAARVGRRASGTNPFLPYDEALWVADLSDTHVCLLNKFNVVEHHVLLVTRVFEEQEEPLGPADFAALWTCLEETAGLCFYNAGEAAGASQRHKHLQAVPLPLGPGDGFPLAERLGSAAPTRGVVVPDGLPFPFALASLDALGSRRPDDAALPLESLYHEMLERTGVVPGRTAYNLLATRRWLWLVPRSQAEWQGIPVNALGFAGALIVPDEAAFVRLRAWGPLALLRAVTPAGERV